MADAPDLGSGSARSGGSSPLSRTNPSKNGNPGEAARGPIPGLLHQIVTRLSRIPRQSFSREPVARFPSPIRQAPPWFGCRRVGDGVLVAAESGAGGRGLRGGATQDAQRCDVRRCDPGRRGALEPVRSTGAHDRRSGDDRIVPQLPALSGPDRRSGARLHRQVPAACPSSRRTGLLPGAVRGSLRSTPRLRVGDGQLPHGIGSTPRRPLRLVGRHRGPRLGHRCFARRHDDL
jgi:hypothetical protein